MKQCSSCKVLKPLEAYTKDRTKKDGLNTVCKDCKSKYKSQYRKINKEKVDSYRQVYKFKKAKSLTKVMIEKKIEFQRTNIIPIFGGKIIKKEYSYKFGYHSEKPAFQVFESKERFKRCACCRTSLPTENFYKDSQTSDLLSRYCNDCYSLKNRKKRYNRTGSMTIRVSKMPWIKWRKTSQMKNNKNLIHLIFGGKCFKCGSTEKLEIDHHIPYSVGGEDTLNNYVLLCQPCNRSKSNKMPKQFYSEKDLERLKNKFFVVT